MARRTRADVIEVIVENGGTDVLAEGIADVLTEAGLSPNSRMADLIIDGHEDEVLADLAAGRIDPRELLETGELHYYGW